MKTKYVCYTSNGTEIQGVACLKRATHSQQPPQHPPIPNAQSTAEPTPQCTAEPKSQSAAEPKGERVETREAIEERLYAAVAKHAFPVLKQELGDRGLSTKGRRKDLEEILVSRMADEQYEAQEARLRRSARSKGRTRQKKKKKNRRLRADEDWPEPPAHLRLAPPPKAPSEERTSKSNSFSLIPEDDKESSEESGTEPDPAGWSPVKKRRRMRKSKRQKLERKKLAEIRALEDRIIAGEELTQPQMDKLKQKDALLKKLGTFEDHIDAFEREERCDLVRRMISCMRDHPLQRALIDGLRRSLEMLTSRDSRLSAGLFEHIAKIIITYTHPVASNTVPAESHPAVQKRLHISRNRLGVTLTEPRDDVLLCLKAGAMSSGVHSMIMHATIPNNSFKGRVAICIMHPYNVIDIARIPPNVGTMVTAVWNRICLIDTMKMCTVDRLWRQVDSKNQVQNRGRVVASRLENGTQVDVSVDMDQRTVTVRRQATDSRTVTVAFDLDARLSVPLIFGVLIRNDMVSRKNKAVLKLNFGVDFW